MTPDQANELYQAGHSIRAIAAHVGMHQSTVLARLRLARTKMRPVGRPKGDVSPIRAALIERVIELRKSGMRSAEIADQVCRSDDVVRRIVSEQVRAGRLAYRYGPRRK